MLRRCGPNERGRQRTGTAGAARAAVFGALLAASAMSVVPAAAQTTPGTAPPQNQPTSPLPTQPISPTPGVPAAVTTPSTTNQLAPGAGPAASPQRVPTFSNAGRGLPGMLGGPPLKGTAGAQDPTADYMRPPVIGPLFCDPAVDLSC